MNPAAGTLPTVAAPIELVVAAAECVRRFGIQRFRLTEVAKVAGVSRGTVYNAFGDKATAMRAGLSYLCGAFIDGLARGVQPKATLREQVGEAAALIYAHVTAPQVLDPPLRTESIITVLLEHYGTELGRSWAGFWAELVGAAQQRGEVDAGHDPTQVGDWIVRVLLGLELMPLTVAGFRDAEDVRNRVSDLLLNGLVPRTAPQGVESNDK